MFSSEESLLENFYLEFQMLWSSNLDFRVASVLAGANAGILGQLLEGLAG